MAPERNALTICIDFNSIETYLALTQTFELQKKVSEDINWLPLTGGMKKFSNKSISTDSDSELERFKLRRQEARDSYMRMNRFRYAQLLNLSNEDIERTCDSNIVAIGLLWVKKINSTKLSDYISIVFESHYRHHQNVEKEEVVVELLKNAGIETRGFSEYLNTEGRDLMNTIQEELAESGVLSSPAYILNSERFHGREHLPLIHWYLSGQQGLPPV